MSARLPRTLTVATVVHAALFGALAVAPARARGPAPSPPDPAALFVITDEPLSAAPPREPPRAEHAEPPSARRLQGSVGDPPPPLLPPASEPPSALALAVAPPVAPSAGWSLPSAPSIDLGTTNYWKRVAPPSATPDLRAGAPPQPGSRLDAALHDDLDRHDRALGLDAAGPLVGAAREASSPALAPDIGSATLDIESDASGLVVSARVVSAVADVPAWSDVAREIVRIASSRRLHLRPGARGLRARLQIVAERVLPSGEHGTTSAGAVPDDVPGGGQACEDAGLTRKCLQGMPVGFSASAADVANVRAKGSRVVRVRILDELTL